MKRNYSDHTSLERSFHIVIRTKEQFDSVFDYLSQIHCDSIRRVAVDADLLLEHPELLENDTVMMQSKKRMELVLDLPPILRSTDKEYLEKVYQLSCKAPILGVMIANLEALGFFQEKKYEGYLFADHSFYLWNKSALSCWKGVLAGACLPLELKSGEQRALLEALQNEEDAARNVQNIIEDDYFWEKMIYGRIPMMVTANCLSKTVMTCQKLKKSGQKEMLFMTDRLGKQFPVLLNCRHCYNIIYNSVPLSLHNEVDKWSEKTALRIQFTIENEAETRRILAFYLERGKELKLPFSEYTTGHEKRGVQ